MLHTTFKNPNRYEDRIEEILRESGVDFDRGEIVDFVANGTLIEVKGIRKYKRRPGFKRIYISTVQLEELRKRGGIVVIVDEVEDEIKVMFLSELEQLIKDRKVYERLDGLRFYAICITKRIRDYLDFDEVLSILDNGANEQREEEAERATG